jgi:hypothetical protein
MSTPDTFTQLLEEELTPAPDSEFAREMDEWAAAGFPRRQETKPRRFRVPSIGWLRSPAGMGAAASALAAAAIAVVLIADSAEQTTTGSGDFAASTTEADPTSPVPTTQEAPSDDDQAGRSLPAPSGGSVAPGERDRKIERQAQLTLAAPGDDFQSVADRVIQTTDKHEGFVLRSQVSTGDNPTGDFQLRIPADRLQPALRDLAALGDVRARSDTGQDVTREYVSVTDQLATARAERRALLRRLASATDDARIQQLRDRLDRNGRELASLRGQIRGLRERTNYAAVSVSLVEGKSESNEEGATGLGDAFDDAGSLLVGSLAWLVRALGVLIPAGIVAAAAWWGARSIRRRRREAVLF